MDTYKINIAGLDRELPLCAVNENLKIAALVIFNDVELTEASAAALLEKMPEFDHKLLTRWRVRAASPIS